MSDNDLLFKNIFNSFKWTWEEKASNTSATAQQQKQQLQQQQQQQQQKQRQQQQQHRKLNSFRIKFVLHIVKCSQTRLQRTAWD